MKRPDCSIVKLMVVVGVVALNLAAARILYLNNPEMLVGIAPIGLALQVAIFQLMRSRGRVRAYWVGFVASGLTAMMAVAWAIHSPGAVLVDSKGTYYKQYEPPIYSVLCECRDVATERMLHPILAGLHVDPMSHLDSKLLRATFACFNAAVWFLPQLLLSMIGGLLIGFFATRSRRTPGSHPHWHRADPVPSEG